MVEAHSYINRLFIWLIVLQFPVVVKGQQIEGDWGVPHNPELYAGVYDLIGEGRGLYFVTFYSQRGNFGMNEYDIKAYRPNSFEEVGTYPVKLPKVAGEFAVYEGTFLLSDSLVCFSSVYNRLKQRYELHVQRELSNNTLQDAYVLDWYLGSGGTNDSRFWLTSNGQANKLLSFRNVPPQKKNNQAIHLNLYNDKLDSIWEHELNLPYFAKNFELQNVLLSNTNDIFILAKVLFDRESWEKDLPDFKYIIIALNPATNDVREFDISMENQTVTDLKFTLDAENNLIIGGLYSNQLRNQKQAGGIFSMKISGESGNVLTLDKRDFEASFLENLLSQKQIEKGKELEDFKIQTIDEVDNGAYFITGEQQYKRENCIPDAQNGRMICTQYYYHNDIFLVLVNASGKIEWMKVAPKRQYSTNDGGVNLSYITLCNENGISLLYYDHPKNFTLIKESGPRYMNNALRGELANISIDYKGKMSRSHITGFKDRTLRFEPYLTYKTSRSTAIVMGADVRSYKLGRMTLTK